VGSCEDGYERSYSVKLCVFMTYSTSRSLCNTLMDPLNVGMYVCMNCLTS